MYVCVRFSCRNSHLLWWFHCFGSFLVTTMYVIMCMQIVVWCNFNSLLNGWIFLDLSGLYEKPQFDTLMNLLSLFSFLFNFFFGLHWHESVYFPTNVCPNLLLNKYFLPQRSAFSFFPKFTWIAFSTCCGLGVWLASANMLEIVAHIPNEK